MAPIIDAIADDKALKSLTIRIDTMKTERTLSMDRRVLMAHVKRLVDTNSGTLEYVYLGIRHYLDSIFGPYDQTRGFLSFQYLTRTCDKLQSLLIDNDQYEVLTSLRESLPVDKRRHIRELNMNLVNVDLFDLLRLLPQLTPNIEQVSLALFYSSQ